MIFIKDFLVYFAALVLMAACSSKTRNKGDAPLPPAPPPVVTPLSTPTASPTPSGNRPFKDGSKNEFGSFRRDDENANPMKRFTGFADIHGSSYTDAANDRLVSFLREQSQASQKDGIGISNRNFAESIRDVKFQNISRDRVAIKVKILTTIDTNRANQRNTKQVISEVTLSGQIRSRFAKLSVIKTTDRGHVVEAGEFRCLDLDDYSCETSLLRVYLRDGAVADVVLRRTRAFLSVKANDMQQHLSPNFKSLWRMFNNTQYRTEFDQPVIKKTLFNSFAVVNGRSEITVKFLFDRAEMLVFRAPLLSTSQSNDDVDVLMKQTVTVDDINSEENQQSIAQTGISYRDMIEEARLTKNNGLGQVQITLNLKTQSAFSEKEEPIQLVLRRTLKPIIDLDEVSVFSELTD